MVLIDMVDQEKAALNDSNILDLNQVVAHFNYEN
jgi:hypothetical protein